MEKYLTDLEVAKIEQFCADEKMYDAVKKVLLAGIYTHGTIQKDFIPDPLQNGAFSLAQYSVGNPIPDEVLGQHIRGMWAGINAFKLAFDKLDDIKSPKESVVSPYNEAI